MHRHFLGSSIALAFGVFLLFAIFAPPEQKTGDAFFTGWMIIVGTLSYRSAKKRKLGTVRDTSIRQTLEIASLGVIVVIAVFRPNLLMNYVVLLWIVSAYLIVRLKVPPTRS